MLVEKKDVPPALADEEILWADHCDVCQGLLYTIRDKRYEVAGQENISCTTVAADGKETIMCDYADARGCHNQYHDECFDAHSCPVHETVKQEA